MRAPLLAAFLLALPGARGQEIISFTAHFSPTNLVPPSPIGFASAGGNLSLTSNYLSFDFCIPRNAALEIHGPAGPGTNAPLIFGPLGCQLYSNACIHEITEPGWFLVLSRPCEAPGGFLLSADQINDLLAGLWYAEVPGCSAPRSSHEIAMVMAYRIILTVVPTVPPTWWLTEMGAV